MNILLRTEIGTGKRVRRVLIENVIYCEAFSGSIDFTTPTSDGVQTIGVTDDNDFLWQGVLYDSCQLYNDNDVPEEVKEPITMTQVITAVKENVAWLENLTVWGQNKSEVREITNNLLGLVEKAELILDSDEEHIDVLLDGVKVDCFTVDKGTSDEGIWDTIQETRKECSDNEEYRILPNKKLKKRVTFERSEFNDHNPRQRC